MFSSNKVGDNISTPFTNNPISLLNVVLSFRSSNVALILLKGNFFNNFWCCKVLFWYPDLYKISLVIVEVVWTYFFEKTSDLL